MNLALTNITPCKHTSRPKILLWCNLSCQLWMIIEAVLDLVHHNSVMVGYRQKQNNYSQNIIHRSTLACFFCSSVYLFVCLFVPFFRVVAKNMKASKDHNYWSIGIIYHIETVNYHSILCKLFLVQHVNYFWYNM